MVAVVAIREPCTEEDSAEVDVVRDVAPVEVGDRHAEIAFQYLDCHGRLLLAYALEAVESPLQIIRAGPTGPHRPSVSPVLVHHVSRREDEPVRHLANVAMQRGRRFDRVADGFRVGSDPHGIEVSQSLPQEVRGDPRPLRGHSLIEEDRHEKGERVIADQFVRLLVRREVDRPPGGLRLLASIIE
jgi:hypothetical protein